MSIFITNLAFTGSAAKIKGSKMAILLASLTAGTAGFLWLNFLSRASAHDTDADTMDYAMTET